jgi:diguanylate cyclase (GGDEF)-like protein
LIYIDLDDFKLINDQYGHHIGDYFLQEVARRIKRQLRSVDMLARIGGDEFVLLLPSVRSRADVDEVASRIARNFDTPFAVEGLILPGAASLGIAMYPENGLNKDELFRFADQAMYVAKFAKRQQRDPEAHAEIHEAPAS